MDILSSLKTYERKREEKNAMMFYEKIGRYTIWECGRDYAVTIRKREEVFRGSLSDCEKFVEMHPYGITRKEREN